jgi:AcrR family transcriptional regulator
MRANLAPADVRDAVLDAAERLLARYGYRKMTMDDLAREAGIGKGTTYLHFPSKQEVVLCSIDRIVERLLGQLLMGQLHDSMAQDLVLRNLSPATARNSLLHCRKLAASFERAPSNWGNPMSANSISASRPSRNRRRRLRIQREPRPQIVFVSDSEPKPPKGT